MAGAKEEKPAHLLESEACCAFPFELLFPRGVLAVRLEVEVLEARA